MPEYLSPGVYVEEIPGAQPIEGVGTSTAGFLGYTERGPENPRLITSWLDFQRWYGGYVPEQSYLAYAVEGFFQNGGQRSFVGRILADDATRAVGAVGDLNVFAIGRGAWGTNIRIKVVDATQLSNTESRFGLHILYFREMPANFVDPTDRDQLANRDRKEPDVLETYDNLTDRPGASNNVVTVLNTSSRLVRVAWADPDNPSPLAPQAFAQLDTAGSDGSAITAGDFDGDQDPIPGGPPEPEDLLGRGRGLAAFEMIDEISLLLVPDEVRTAPTDLRQVSEAVMNQCEILKDRFAIVSALQAEPDPQNIQPLRDTSYAAFYYPWIRVYDSSIDDLRLVPPTGHIAGIFARTDIERGVHKAPANEVVRGARELQFPVTKGQQDILNPKGVNCIRDFRSDGRGIRLWGARTSSSLGEWKYVNVRRLFLFIEESIDEGTQWVVFEPNHEPTWAKVRRSITNFLITVWRNGALMGTTQDEAFFVKCDRTTMTQDDWDNGRLICYIGIAPVKPAEFVIFRISQKTVEA